MHMETSHQPVSNSTYSVNPARKRHLSYEYNDSNPQINIEHKKIKPSVSKNTNKSNTPQTPLPDRLESLVLQLSTNLYSFSEKLEKKE